MTTAFIKTQASPASLDTHSWVHPLTLAYLPGERTPAIDRAMGALLESLRQVGCTIESEPTAATELILTTTRFERPVQRKEALLFHAKRRYRLRHRPQVMTVVDIDEAEYQYWLDHFTELAALPPDAPAGGYRYPGLGPQAVDVMLQQAQRGGPEVAMGRFFKGHTVSLRVMALRTTNGRPYRATYFDLAGAHPTDEAHDLSYFAREASARILAAACTREVNNHRYIADAISQQRWDALSTPDAMIKAGPTFTEYGFFTDPVSVEKILGYRGLSDAISAHYSEGCYAAYDPDIQGLITTATGSARLVDKRTITRNDQAILAGVKPAGDGAIVKLVSGLGRVVPSVEAVELMGICQAVPTQHYPNTAGELVDVPVVRAILHGHLGMLAYDPRHVECLRLDEPYYHHLVSCGTGALAAGTAAAFRRSEAMYTPDDSRQVVFLEQPGHGIIVAEKWVSGKQPFDLIREYLDAGYLQVTMDVPQGEIHWESSWAYEDDLVLVHKAREVD